MRFRRLLFGLAIIALGSGLTVYAASSIQNTQVSSWTSSSRGGIPGPSFSYGGGTLTPDNPPLVIAGTTGVADLMILKAPLLDLNGYVCHHLFPSNYDCSHFGGGNYFNNTILHSYLQTYKPTIALSETIVDQNITLNFPVSSPTNVTLVLDLLNSGTSTVYWQWTVRNKTLSYPLLGYTEHASGIATLPNLALMVTGSGAAVIAIVLIQNRSKTRQPPVPLPRAVVSCPGCGAENLSFAEKCGHCGRPLGQEVTRLSTPALTN